MTATFIAHSGFLVELPSALLLFDWESGALPPLTPKKPLVVFASHRHEDHFNPQIFSLDDGSRPVRFLLGKDIRLTPRNRERWRLSDGTAARCLCLGGGETAEPLPGVKVETLPSTDEGVAFLAASDGKTVYHAGDLNWWHWEGEDTGWNRNMEVNFKRFLEPLRNRQIDLAMVPLDPRQEEAADWGLLYFLEIAQASRVLPMHQWGNFALTAKFLAAHPDRAGQVLEVPGAGAVFDFPETA
jgi:L-ascorbate metabolism protein UlaG (beta-lactamase superfamily)